MGPLSIKYEENASGVSTETRSIIEQEVKRLTSEAYGRVKSLLEQHKDELKILADALMERETLSGNQIKELLRREKKLAD